MAKERLLDSCFFEDNDGNPVTVNSERYIQMLESRFIPAIQRRNMNIHTVVFQQNEVPPYCSNISLKYQRQHFLGNRLLSRRTDNSRPPYSSDLNPADYFLWGYLKERAHAGNPRINEDLKESMKREIRRIPAHMLTIVVESFNVCIAAVIQQCGVWIEHVMNY